MPSGDRRSDQSDHNSINNKRCPDKIICRTDQFHDTDLFTAHGNTDCNRIADQEDGNTEQDQNDTRGNITDQTVKTVSVCATISTALLNGFHL